MPQLTIEQQRAVALAQARLRLQQNTSTPPQTSRGASGSWEMSPEQLPAPLRIPLQGLAQIGQGATNVLRMPFDLAKTAYESFDPSTIAPEEVPVSAMAGPLGRFVQRAVLGPQIEQAKKAMEPSEPGPPLTANGPTVMGNIPIPIPNGVERAGHALAAGIPFLGPFAAHLGETIGAGRPLEAAGEAMTAAVLPKLAGEAKTYRDMAPVRKGQAVLDYSTMKPERPEPPILIKHGLPAPEIPKGKVATFELPTQKIAEGLGLLDDVEGTQLKNAIAEVYPDLKYAQKHAPGIRGPVNTPAKLRAVLDWNGDRLWNTILEPELKQSGKMRNLATLSEDVQAQLPEHVKQFYGELVQSKLDPIQKVLDRYKKPGEAIPQVDPMMIHGLVKAIRNELDLATTPMEQGIQRQLPKGELLFKLNEVLRDKLYEHVQTTRGVDLRPVARKYGMNATIKGEAANLTTPKGFFEHLFGSYTFPTPRAVAARIGETAGKQMMNRLKSLKRGFDFPMTPEEEALVTRPSPSKPRPKSSIAGPPVKLPPTFDYGIEEGPLAPEPLPGPTVRLHDYPGQSRLGLSQRWAGVERNPARMIGPGALGGPGRPLPPQLEPIEPPTPMVDLGAPGTKEMRKGRLLPAGRPEFQRMPAYGGGRADVGGPAPGAAYPGIPVPSANMVTLGPAKGMKLARVELDPITHKPVRYTYEHPTTGKRLSFETPQK